MVNGLDRREQNKWNCGWKLNWAFFDIERWLYNIDIYFAPLFIFLVPLVHFLYFPLVCGSEEMSSQLSKVLCQISRGMARHCSPAAPAALTIPTMSTMRRIQVVAEVAEVATWFWPIFRYWRHLGDMVRTLPLKKVASPSHRYSSCWISSSPWSTWWGHAAAGLKPSVMNVAGLWALRLLTFIMQTIGLLDLLPLPLMHMKRAVTLSCLASEVEEQCFTRPPFSRMRSEGFPFIVWRSGGWTLVRLEWLVASSSRRRRVVVASLIPYLRGKLQNLSFSKVSKQVVMSFCVAGVALCDIPTCLITCQKCQNWRTSRTKCWFCCAHVSRLGSSIFLLQALWYTVVLGEVLCESFVVHRNWEVLCASFVVQGSAGKDFVQALYEVVLGRLTLYTPHSTLYTFHSALHTFHSTLQTGNRGNMYCLQAMFSIRVFVH